MAAQLTWNFSHYNRNVALSVLVPLLLSLGAGFDTSEKEAALGAHLAAQMERETTPLGFTDVDKYVAAVGRRIAAQIPGDLLIWTFRVIRDQRGGSLCEPLSLPGGYIFVPVRLIVAAQNEDEFAGMLAHAMAHAAARHGMRMASRGEIASLATVPLIFMGGAFGDESAVVPRAYAETRRQFELDADQIAAKTLAAAGYDPQALLRFVSRRQPQDSVRIANLERAMQDLPAPTENMPSGTFDRIRSECRQTSAPVPSLLR